MSDKTHFLGVVEADLADCHAAVFFQVRPGGVDDCNIVSFVACEERNVSQVRIKCQLFSLLSEGMARYDERRGS